MGDEHALSGRRLARELLDAQKLKGGHGRSPFAIHRRRRICQPLRHLHDRIGVRQVEIERHQPGIAAFSHFPKSAIALVNRRRVGEICLELGGEAIAQGQIIAYGDKYLSAQIQTQRQLQP